jgi:hypothetical protein
MGRSLAHSVRLVIAGKGTIEVEVTEAATCTDLDTLRTQTQLFKVSGGTGVYAGASSPASSSTRRRRR